MDGFIILLLAGVAMALFATAVMAIYTILEADHRMREIRRYARRQIIRQMEHEKTVGSPSVDPNEKVDLHTEWHK